MTKISCGGMIVINNQGRYANDFTTKLMLHGWI